jgi:hypothetical protein
VEIAVDGARRHNTDRKHRPPVSAASAFLSGIAPYRLAEICCAAIDG